NQRGMTAAMLEKYEAALEAQREKVAALEAATQAETSVAGDDGAAEAAPTITGTPNSLTQPEVSKAHAKARRYAEMFKRSPRTKLAYDLAGAIGDQQQELALYVAIEVVEQARHFHPH